MPKRSRRVAARQAELSQRKRRAPKRSSHPEAHAPVARSETPTPSMERPSGPAPAEAPAPVVPRTAPLQRPRPAAVPRSIAPYIWPEIKRIGILTGLILVILAALTAFLR